MQTRQFNVNRVITFINKALNSHTQEEHQKLNHDYSAEDVQGNSPHSLSLTCESSALGNRSDSRAVIALKQTAES